MKFISKWIRTDKFANLSPLNMFCKEYQPKEIPESSIKSYQLL